MPPVETEITEANNRVSKIDLTAPSHLDETTKNSATLGNRSAKDDGSGINGVRLMPDDDG